MQFHNAITGEAITPLPWQEALKAGDCYVIEQPAIGLLCGNESLPLTGVEIFGQIIEKAQEPGFFIVKAYSAWVPDGEDGLMCVVEPSRLISEEEFQRQTRALTRE